MHCRELVELAAIVAVQGPARIRDYPAAADGAEQYQIASLERTNRWLRALRRPQLDATRARPLLEEILVTEVLTRVWAGAACACDQVYTGKLQQAARSVYAAHLSARNLVLRFLVDGVHHGARESLELDRIRRRSERWSDLLLGYLMLPASSDRQRLALQEFAFESERMAEFARDLAEDRQAPQPLASQLLRSSLCAGFREGLSDETPSAALNQKIALATLECFPGGQLRTTDSPRPLWLERMAHTADDAEGLVSELLSLHRP
jgi:hypothetical protein